MAKTNWKVDICSAKQCGIRLASKVGKSQFVYATAYGWYVGELKPPTTQSRVVCYSDGTTRAFAPEWSR